jgi:hypothetical protein
MAFVERCDCRSTLQHSCGNNQIVVPNHFSRRFKGSPASRRATNLTLSSITEHSFHGIHFPPRKGTKCNLCVRYDLLPMSRVAHDRCDLKLLGVIVAKPAMEVKVSSFAANNQVRVQSYRHLFFGVFSALRAACRSRTQAWVSAAGNSTLAIALAKSRPVQTFSPSGMSRAKDDPFLSKTKVTFW